MKLEDAKRLAREDAKKTFLRIVIVKEGPHADDFAEYDTDGESYGYCSVKAFPYLYKYGTKVGVVHPNGKFTS
jgi:hypothetical protein